MTAKDELRAMGHDAILAELRALAKKRDAAKIAGAFVASLGAAPGRWRASLIALAAARAVPKHARTKTFSGGACRECGLAAKNALEGPSARGVLLPGDLAGALVALRSVDAKSAPKPTRDDIKRFGAILALVGELPAHARSGQLEKAIAAKKLVAGNAYDRRHVLETLAACGILETPEHPGFSTKWTSFAARQDRPSARTEVDPPLAFWTAGHGVNAVNVRAWLGHLGVAAPRASAPRAVAIAVASKRAEKATKRASRDTELKVGDGVAFAVGKTWVAAIVIDRFRDKGGRRPIVELVEWLADVPPSATELKKARALGTRWGARRIAAPIIANDLWTREGPNGTWAVIATGLRAPSRAHLAPPLGMGSLADVAEMAAEAAADQR